MQPDLDRFKQILTLTFGEEIDYNLELDSNVIVLKVAQDDIALVIGKGGRNANALRAVTNLYNKLHNTNIQLEITEAEDKI